MKNIGFIGVNKMKQFKNIKSKNEEIDIMAIRSKSLKYHLIKLLKSQRTWWNMDNYFQPNSYCRSGKLE